jgi:hypothetical protein
MDGEARGRWLDDFTPKAFAVFAPMVIAGIGAQAETIEDRSIIIRMQRKTKDERTESFRGGGSGEGEVLARKMARWVADSAGALRGSDPDMGELQNRVADNWRPLFAVADCAGGEWPERARLIAANVEFRTTR